MPKMLQYFTKFLNNHSYPLGQDQYNTLRSCQKTSEHSVLYNYPHVGLGLECLYLLLSFLKLESPFSGLLSHTQRR